VHGLLRTLSGHTLNTVTSTRVPSALLGFSKKLSILQKICFNHCHLRRYALVEWQQEIVQNCLRCCIYIILMGVVKEVEVLYTTEIIILFQLCG